MAAWAVSPEKNSSTSFGSTGMMMPNDSMSSMTVTRMKSTAARRGVEAIGRSLMADASYQADTSACRDKTDSGSARKEFASELRRLTVFRRDVQPGEMYGLASTHRGGEIQSFAEH